MKIICNWPEGCKTILHSYNKTGLCGVHQKAEEIRARLVRISEQEIRDSYRNPSSQLQQGPAIAFTGPTIQDSVIESVASFYSISRDDLLGPKRNTKFVVPRQVVAYILRSIFKKSFPDIAFILKRQNHTTIISACERIEELMRRDEGFRKNIEKVCSMYKA